MQTIPTLTSQLYYGSVHTRLQLARDIHHKFGVKLLADPVFLQEFELLQRHSAAVKEYMTEMDLGTLCTSCATEPKGGCCSLFMANETDAVQICMNILAGKEVYLARDDGEECVYLGDRGCIFEFKPMFCLNYLCNHIREGRSATQISELERLTGTLLRQQYLVEQKILYCIRG